MTVITFSSDDWFKWLWIQYEYWLPMFTLFISQFSYFEFPSLLKLITICLFYYCYIIGNNPNQLCSQKENKSWLYNQTDFFSFPRFLRISRFYSSLINEISAIYYRIYSLYHVSTSQELYYWECIIPIRRDIFFSTSYSFGFVPSLQTSSDSCKSSV